MAVGVDPPLEVSGGVGESPPFGTYLTPLSGHLVPAPAIEHQC